MYWKSILAELGVKLRAVCEHTVILIVMVVWSSIAAHLGLLSEKYA